MMKLTPEIAARRTGRLTQFRALAASHVARGSARLPVICRGLDPEIVSTIRSR